MSRASILVWGLFVLLLSRGSSAQHALEPAHDPANVARGLDVSIHAPAEGAPGAVLPVALRAFGFPRVDTVLPLRGARVTAQVDAESLGVKPSVAPEEAAGTTDSEGRVVLGVRIPLAAGQKTSILVKVEYGSHTRTRAFDLHARNDDSVRLFVDHVDISPGESVSAWAFARERGAARRHAKMNLSLLEEDHARATLRMVADEGGMANGTLRIPAYATPPQSLSIRVECEGTVSMVPLRFRQGRVAEPHFDVSWQGSSARAAARATFVISLYDASGEPVRDHAVRYWIGPKGTSAPAMTQEGPGTFTVVRTNELGQFEGGSITPRLFRGSETELTVVARTLLEGRELEQSSALFVKPDRPDVRVEVETGALVPGTKQRGFITATVKHRPFAGALRLIGDGLDKSVRTDERGRALFDWDVPAGIGAKVSEQTCGAGIGAHLRLSGAEGDAHIDETICLTVNRDQSTLLQTHAAVVRAGQPVAISRSGAADPMASMVATTSLAGASSVHWLGPSSLDWVAPPGAQGPIRFESGERSVGSEPRARLLVVPNVLPSVTMKVVGGRFEPDGYADVVATLSDGEGRPLQGRVLGASLALSKGLEDSLSEMDTRKALCHAESIGDEDCEAFLAGASPEWFAVVLNTKAPGTAAYRYDPRHELKERLAKVFGETVRTIESRVADALDDRTNLVDVRRKVGDRWVFNPELFAESKTETPGGEELGLQDIVALDPQVTFDNVARRVIRARIFKLIVRVRAFRRSHSIEEGDPALVDPNAILRRMLRDGELTESALLDPWGNLISFVRTAAPSSSPFLAVTRGYALASAGPDGRFGTGDDMRDPFQRVVASRTPYAVAMQEDDLVDARFDADVSEATMSKWDALFERLTGTGRAYGLGGMGEGGGGTGNGMGLGGIGKMRTQASPDMSWTPPVRTDKSGRALVRVPLRNLEGTWKIHVIAFPDGSTPATTSAEVATTMPVSISLDAGGGLFVGDAVGAKIVVRNRSAREVRARVLLRAEGGVAFGKNPPSETKTLDLVVPPKRAVTEFIPISALRKGDAKVRAELSSPEGNDSVVLAIRVAEPGTPVTLAQTALVRGETSFRIRDDGRHVALHDPVLVMERGLGSVFERAAAALDPTALGSADDLVDSLEVAGRTERYAFAENRPKMGLGAAELWSRAFSRVRTRITDKSEGTSVVRLRAHALARTMRPGETVAALRERATEMGAVEAYLCARAIAGHLPNEAPTWTALAAIPDESRSRALFDLLDTEPPPTAAGALPCFTQVVSEAATRAVDPRDLAAIALALLGRPHRIDTARAIVQKLASSVRLDADGQIQALLTRADRASVYAALVLGRDHITKPTAEALVAQLVSLQDASGTFGSVRATRHAVVAMLAYDKPSAADESVEIVVKGKRSRMKIALGDATRVPLESAEATVIGRGVLARVEASAIRPFAKAGVESAPYEIEMAWPASAERATFGSVTVSVRPRTSAAGTVAPRVLVRLPPGVEMSSRITGAQMVPGGVLLAFGLGPATMTLPVRFGLPGDFLVGEAQALMASSTEAPSFAPSRRFVVR